MAHAQPDLAGPYPGDRSSTGGGRVRRRGGARALLVGASALAALVWVLRPGPVTQPTAVLVGPGAQTAVPAPDAVPTTAPLELVPGQPLGYRIDFSVPDGWQQLVAGPDRILLATRPLAEGDRALALLARDDGAFAAFPPDGVVVVVGNDPVEAKYRLSPDGSAIGPGPAYDLGPAKALPGGMRVWRGDVPQSPVKIAAYAGPDAPPARVAEARTIARGLQLIRTGDPAVRPPPPPPGSRPGLPTGALPVAEDGLPEVAKVAAAGSTLVLVAGRDCAYLRWADARPSEPGYSPLGGGCAARSADPPVETMGGALRVIRDPSVAPVSVAMFRVGPGVARVTARSADGRTLAASVGADGWGVAAGEGRVVALVAFDAGGRRLGEVPVG